MLAAVLMVLPAAAVAAPAEAVTAPTVALYPDGASLPPTVPAVHSAISGESLYAYGRLPAGTTSAEVQRLRPSGAWIATGTSPGVATTYFSQVRAPAPLGHYQFRVQAKGSYGTVVSAIWKLDVVVQKNTFSFATPRSTGLVEGVGSVTPPRPGGALHVQVLESGAWQNVATVGLDTQGRYRFGVLAHGTGAQVYRTAPFGVGNGSPPQTIQVQPPLRPFAAVDLTGIDSVYGRVPVRGGDTLDLGSDLNAPSAMLWALPAGQRTFGATFRASAQDNGATVQLVVEADSRLLLVTTLPAGQDVPVSLDVTGASRLRVGVSRDPYSEWDPPQTLMIRPRLTSRSVSAPVTSPLVYLANLTPVERTACVVVEGVETSAGRPGSLHWGRLSQACPDGAAIAYDLGGDYVRLRAGTGIPEYGGGGLGNIDGGQVTVLGDDQVLGTFSVQYDAPRIDLDVTGVRRLRFVFARNPGTTSGEMAVLTPTVVRR